MAAFSGTTMWNWIPEKFRSSMNITKDTTTLKGETHKQLAVLIQQPEVMIRKWTQQIDQSSTTKVSGKAKEAISKYFKYFINTPNGEQNKDKQKPDMTISFMNSLGGLNDLPFEVVAVIQRTYEKKIPHVNLDVQLDMIPLALSGDISERHKGRARKILDSKNNLRKSVSELRLVAGVIFSTSAPSE